MCSSSALCVVDGWCVSTNRQRQREREKRALWPLLGSVHSRSYTAACLSVCDCRLVLLQLIDCAVSFCMSEEPFLWLPPQENGWPGQSWQSKGCPVPCHWWRSVPVYVDDCAFGSLSGSQRESCHSCRPSTAMGWTVSIYFKFYCAY